MYLKCSSPSKNNTLQQSNSSIITMSNPNPEILLNNVTINSSDISKISSKNQLDLFIPARVSITEDNNSKNPTKPRSISVCSNGSLFSEKEKLANPFNALAACSVIAQKRHSRCCSKNSLSMSQNIASTPQEANSLSSCINSPIFTKKNSPLSSYKLSRENTKSSFSGSEKNTISPISRYKDSSSDNDEPDHLSKASESLMQAENELLNLLHTKQENSSSQNAAFSSSSTKQNHLITFIFPTEEEKKRKNK